MGDRFKTESAIGMGQNMQQALKELYKERWHVELDL